MFNKITKVKWILKIFVKFQRTSWETSVMRLSLRRQNVKDAYKLSMTLRYLCFSINLRLKLLTVCFTTSPKSWSRGKGLELVNNSWDQTKYSPACIFYINTNIWSCRFAETPIQAMKVILPVKASFNICYVRIYIMEK